MTSIRIYAVCSFLAGLFCCNTCSKHLISTDEVISNTTTLDGSKDTLEAVTAKVDSPPIANAGKNLNVVFPQNQVYLYGNGSTDDNSIVSYEWEYVPTSKYQPLTVDMKGVRSSILHLLNLEIGEYLFSLRVTDAAGQSDVDMIRVTVISSVKCSLPLIPGSRITGSTLSKNYSVGEQAQINCDENFRFPHSRSPTIHIVCREDRTWTDLQGNNNIACERIGGCPTPYIEHGFVIPKDDGYMPGDSALLICDNGFTMRIGRMSFIDCDNAGTWKNRDGTTDPLVCKAMFCKAAKPVVNAHMKIESPGRTSLIDKDIGVPEGTQVSYICETGYTLEDNEVRITTCKNGQWLGPLPKCVPYAKRKTCPEPKDIPHSYKSVFGSADPVPSVGKEEHYENTKVLYFCNPGYANIQPSATLNCKGGVWQGILPQCVKACEEPPSIANGKYNFLGEGNSQLSGIYEEGTKVHYYCHNGYTKELHDTNIAVVVCKDSNWEGHKPTCVKRTHCDKPQDIQYGNWVILSDFVGSVSYTINTKIMYECDEGYKSIGNGDIVCLSTGYWSDHAPKCVPKDLYCSEPSPIGNGYTLCKPHPCDYYKVSTEVHFVCNHGYAVRDGDTAIQTCLKGGNWSGTKPVCLAVDHTTKASNFVHINANTMTVVIATSCGVLGLLVIVMVVVALQRRMKPRTLCPPCPSVHSHPPTYPEQRGATVDEHDRVALIAFADGQHGISVVLPSYEEATRGRVGPRLSRFNSDASSHSSSGRSSRGDYRPLPSIPHTLRGVPPEHHRDHHRNSIITTTSTTTRDNLSLAFGSMDTVNVSDGTSTSVTVDTYDSMASNPSIATSQRATAGSIESSSTHGSLANDNDDAPLLDDGHTNTDTMRSQGSRSMESYTNTDTLRSQTHSESSAIVEVPEESKYEEEA